MADTALQPPAAKTTRAKPASFTPGATAYRGKDVDFGALAPHAEPEPTIFQGIDLAGRTQIVFAAGRGKTGKTTLLRWMAETSIQRDSASILADIDPSNPSFSRYFDNVARPRTDKPAGVAQWLQQLIAHCAVEHQSAIVDLRSRHFAPHARNRDARAGGRDGSAGVAPVLLYLLATQAEDLTPALTLSARGFVPAAQALVLNEVAIDTGTTRADAFGRPIGLPGLIDLAKTSVPAWIPRLYPAEAIEARRCPFFDSRDGQVTPALGRFDTARLRAWLDAMNRRLAGVGSLIS